MKKQVLWVVVVWGMAALSGADVWYVDGGNASGTEDGTAWASAFTTVQAGIDAAYANGGGEVWVAQGVYDEVRNTQVGMPPLNTGSILLRPNVELYGGFAGTESSREQRDWDTHPTVLDGALSRDGEAAYHVIIVGSQAVLDGFTIQGGSATGDETYSFDRGGGIAMENAASTIQHCVVTGNEGEFGGGIFTFKSPTVITDCRFEENAAGSGGGGYVYESLLTVSDCTFTDCSATASGAGLYLYESDAVLTGCSFSGGTAEFAGGLYNKGGIPQVTSCTFTENDATKNGGGVYNSDSQASLSKCTLTGNTAQFGGGAFSTENTPAFDDCTFTDNTAAEGQGGALCTYDAAVTATRCRFSGNAAEYGGGAYNTGAAAMAFDGCWFISNSAVDHGGGMFNSGSSPSIVNCAFDRNTAEQYGAGMYNYENAAPTLMCVTFSGNTADVGAGGIRNVNSSPTLTNCLLWGDEPTAMANSPAEDDTSAPVVTYSDVEGGWEGTGNLDADPLFVDAPAGDLRLQETSPVIDEGTGTDAPAVDIAGVPRPTRTGYDMGAYEFTRTPVAVFEGTPVTGLAPLEVTFVDGSIPGVSDITSWSWDFGDGSSSTEQSPVHTYSSAGVYTVVLTVTTAQGSDTETQTDYVTAHTAPTAAFTAEPSSGPIPLDVEFTDTSTPGTTAITSWYWHFGDNETSTEQNPTHRYSASGEYLVSLYVTSEAGSDSAVSTVVAEPPAEAPTAAFAATPTFGRAPLTVYFTDQSTPGTGTLDTWAWDFGDGGTSADQNPTHIYTSQGNFTVALTVSTEDGSDSQTTIIRVDAAPEAPVAAFSATPAQGPAPLTVQFSDESTPGTASIETWAWDFGDGATSADQNPSHVFGAEGSYTVSLTVVTEDGQDTATQEAAIVVSGEGEGEGEGEVPGCCAGGKSWDLDSGEPLSKQYGGDTVLIGAAAAATLLAGRRRGL